MADRRRFSPSDSWDQVRRLFLRDGRLLIAIAGVFFLLPSIALGLIVPPVDEARGLAAAFSVMQPYLPLLFIAGLVQFTGQLAILALLLSAERPTVGQAIVIGLQMLLFYFVANLIAGIGIGVGLMILILPGLWLLARLYPLGALMIAEQERSPIAAIRRTFVLTAGNAFPIFAYLFIVAIVYFIVSMAVTLVAGVVLPLTGLGMQPGEAGTIVAILLSSVVAAAGATIFALMQASIYRQLVAGPDRATAVID